MKWFILINSLIISSYSYGQLNIRYQLDTIHQEPHTMFYSFQEKNDTLYIIGQRWEEEIPNIFYNKSFLVKVDRFGDVIDYKEVNFFVSYGKLILTSDNSLTFAGGDYYGNLTFFKYSLQLDSLWTRYIDFTTANINLEGRASMQISDKNFILLGRQVDYNNNTEKEYIIKTDSLGNEIWRRGYNMPSGVGRWVTPTAIFETSDSNYIALQTLRRYDQGFSAYEEVTSIEKIDTSGNQIWEYKTPVNRLIAVNDGLPTEDNGVVFCGTEGTKVWAGVFYQGYICKIDSLRQVEWEYSLGTTEGSFFYDITKMNDGSYLASGIDVLTYPDGALVNNSDSIHEAGWLVKFAPDGTKLWERHFMKVYDIPMAHIINETQELSNGDLLSVGYMFTGLSSYAGYWGWLIRTDSFGCIVPGCQLLDNTENVAVVFDNEVTVFPNPIAIGSASDVVNFKFDKVINEKAVIRVYSGLGQLVGETALNHSDIAKINVSEFNSGMYFYGVYVEGVLVKQGQILVQR